MRAISTEYPVANIMPSPISSHLMRYVLVILTWCSYLASASASLSTSFDKIERSQSNRNIIDSTINESDSDIDEFGRYLTEDIEKNQKRFNMNSQSMLIVCTVVCFILFFCCCFRLIHSVRYEGGYDDVPRTSSEATRAAIIANLSQFQMRAVLDILFRDDKKFADTKNRDNYHDTSIEDQEGDTMDAFPVLLATPGKKGMFGEDEESQVTPPTHHMRSPSPDSSQGMILIGHIPSPLLASVPMLTFQGDPLSNEYESVHHNDNSNGSGLNDKVEGLGNRLAPMNMPNETLSLQPRLQISETDEESAADVASFLAHPLSPTTTFVEKQGSGMEVSKAELNGDNADSMDGILCSICLDSYGKFIKTSVHDVYRRQAFLCAPVSFPIIA